jgi:hypothetical protein
MTPAHWLTVAIIGVLLAWVMAIVTIIEFRNRRSP